MKTDRIFIIAAVALTLVGCEVGGGNGKTDDGKLEYSPKLSEVTVTKLERRRFERQLVANGKLAAATKSSLSFGTSGTIASIPVSNGQWVSEGTVLAELESDGLRDDLKSAETSLAKARLELLDVLIGMGFEAGDTTSVPQDMLETAKMKSGYTEAKIALDKARHSYESAKLVAPFSGRVADIKLRAHDATGSDPFCSLMDDSRLDVDFKVLESEYGFMSKGLAVKVQPFGSQGSAAKGAVTEINPSVDDKGQVAVRARISNDGTLIDGMNAKVIVEKNVEQMLVVPKSAVVIRDNMDVLIRYHNGKAEWVYVNILMSNAESHAVEANSDRGAHLAEGDSIIVSGNLNLAEGSVVSLKKAEE